MSADGVVVPSINSHGDAQLIKIITVLLLAKGILVDENTLLQLTDISIEYFHKLSNQLRNYTEIQRRKKPVLADVKLLFRLCNIDVHGLFVESQRSKFVREKYNKDLTEIAQSIPPVNGPVPSDAEENVDAESLPFFNNQHYEISELVHVETKRPNYIPSYLPELPPDYTYQNTPKYMDTITDLKTLRVNLVNQSRSTEKSLYTLIDDDTTKWKLRFEAELEQVSEIEDIMSDYEVESPLHEYSEDVNDRKLDEKNGQGPRSDDKNDENNIQEPSAIKEDNQENDVEMQVSKPSPDTVIPEPAKEVETAQESGTQADSSASIDQVAKTEEVSSDHKNDDVDSANKDQIIPGNKPVDIKTDEKKDLEDSATPLEKDANESVEKGQEVPKETTEKDHTSAHTASGTISEHPNDTNKLDNIQPSTKESLVTTGSMPQVNGRVHEVKDIEKQDIVDLTVDENKSGHHNTIDNTGDIVSAKVKDSTKFDFIAYAQLRRSIVERRQQSIVNKRVKRQHNVFMQAEKYYGPYAQLELTDEIDQDFKDKVSTSFKSCIKSIRQQERIKQQKLAEIIEHKREQEKQAEMERQKAEYVFGFNPNNTYSSSEDEDEEFPDFQVADEKKGIEEETNRKDEENKREEEDEEDDEDDDDDIDTIDERPTLSLKSPSKNPEQDEESDDGSDLGMELENIMQQQQEEPMEHDAMEESDSDEDMEDV